MFPEYRYNNVQNRPLEGNRNIVFDTDYARYFEYGDYHSYTFPVLNTPYGEGLENIVFWLNDEGGYNIALVYYALTEEEKVYLEHGISIHPEDVLITTLNEEYEPMGLFDTPCFYIILAYCRYGNHTGGRYEDGGRCPGYAEYVTPVGDCGSGGTGGSGDPPPPPPPPNPDDPPPHGPGGFGPNPHTSPTLPPYYQPIKDLYLQIAGDLPAEYREDIKDWLHNNPEIAMDISQFMNIYLGDLSIQERKDLVLQGIAFLVDNNYSQEAEAFFWEAVKAWMNDGEVDWEELIIIDSTFSHNQCLEDVYNKFKEGTNTISHYIENFVPEGSAANLTLQTDDNFGINFPNYISAGAITSAPDNYMISITFNTDPNLSTSVSNFPSIILAVEFMHEMIHAEMYRKLLAYAQEPNIPWTPSFINSLRNDFPGLWDYYTRWWLNLPPDQQATSAQHQLMAQHYIDIMSDALADYDNNQHSQDFYEALSWIGLKNTVAWNNLTPNEQTNINNHINNAMQNPPCI